MPVAVRYGRRFIGNRLVRGGNAREARRIELPLRPAPAIQGKDSVRALLDTHIRAVVRSVRSPDRKPRLPERPRGVAPPARLLLDVRRLLMPPRPRAELPPALPEADALVRDHRRELSRAVFRKRRKYLLSMSYSLVIFLSFRFSVF